MKLYLACPSCLCVLLLVINFCCIGVFKWFKKDKCNCKCHDNHQKDKV